MTFTGYTQYFANLTYINNDLTEDVEGNRWRDGDYADEEPKHKHPQPREFKFEVEYSTFDDKYYKLRDMTVMEYVKLAYRLSRKKIKGKAIDAEDFDFEVDEDASGSDSEDGEDPGLELRDEREVDEDSEDEEVQDEDLADGEARAEKKKGKKHKKKKKKKKHHKNKAWKEFLDRAFVSTLSEEDLDKMT
jgi:endopolyphosphatase